MGNEDSIVAERGRFRVGSISSWSEMESSWHSMCFSSKEGANKLGSLHVHRHQDHYFESYVLTFKVLNF